MSKLEKLYNALDSLQEAGLSFNDDLLAQISELEEKIIKNDILPIIQDTIQPALVPVKRDLVLVVEYSPNQPISVKLSRKRNFANQLPDAKIIDFDSPVEHTTHLSPKIKHTKSPRTNLRITLPNGYVINNNKAVDSIIEFVKYIGVEKCRKVGLIRCKIPLISNAIDNKYSERQKPLGDGWYLMTCTSTENKKEDIEAIAKYYKLNVKVEIV